MCVKYPRQISCDCCSPTRIVGLMLYRQKIPIDYSEYPLNHPLYSAVNRKVIGFFKDELNSVPMQQFVGLRPKCYAFLGTGKVSNNMLQHTNPVEKKTAKGVKRRVKDAPLHFKYYLDAPKTFIHISVDRTLSSLLCILCA